MADCATNAYAQEHRYPGWTANVTDLEKKLHKIALHLAAVERSTGIQVKVNFKKYCL